MSYPGKVLVTIALFALALAAWQLRSLLLLVFGGFLVATVLTATAAMLRRVTHTSYRVAVVISVVLALALLVLLGWLIGGVLAAQVRELAARLPGAVAAARTWLGASPAGPYLLQLWDEARRQEVSWSRVAAGAAGVTLGILGNTLLVLLVGVFIAAEPQVYRNGFLRLVPVRHRRAVGAALEACARGLRGWLKGQALSMAFVGLATGIGLALLGVQLALVLGVLAGLLDFVPFFGPIFSGILAVLLALYEGPRTAMYVAILVIIIQQLESDVVVPLVQRHTVQLPPAVGIVGVLLAAGLFGLIGLLMATPLIVVAMVLVRELYVVRALEAKPHAGHEERID